MKQTSDEIKEKYASLKLVNSVNWQFSKMPNHFKPPMVFQIAQQWFKTQIG